jgi:citrate lyase subunit beta/citryl-CoA lyase
MRSWLFVPADSEKKIAKALSSSADIVILDLEDSVPLQNKQRARQVASTTLAEKAGISNLPLYVRVNAPDTGLTGDDIQAVIANRPDGFMLPKSSSGKDVQILARMIAERAEALGQETYAPPIIAIATETAAALFGLGSYGNCGANLVAMCWGAEDLSADLGAMSVFDETGQYTHPYQLARSLCLFGARAAGVEPIDGVFTDFRDMDGLRASCKAALRDGFTGKLAIHPAQLPVINEVFTPSPADIRAANAIIKAFEEAGNAGVIGFEGKMLDRPHLLRAQKLISRARRYASSPDQ